jgi:hypothetical protein
MKKIGIGWQCTVYDLGNGKVIKKKNSTLAQFFKILFAAGPLALIKGEVKRVNNDYYESLQIVQKVLENPVFDPAVFGNPIIDISASSYIQDKVIPLNVAMETASLEDQKGFYEKYIDLLKYLWSFGVHEKVFNITINAGIDSQNRLVLIDLGELTSDKNKAMQDITTKRWLRAFSYRFMFNAELKEYYRDLMQKELTGEELDRCWK